MKNAHYLAVAVGAIAIVGLTATGAVATGPYTKINTVSATSTAAHRSPLVHFRCTGGELRLYRNSNYRPPACDTNAPANRGICFTVSSGQAGFASVNNQSDKDLTVFPGINCTGAGIPVYAHHSNEDIIIYSFARR